ncbi:NADH:flavin oxidoreductase/NADH oxidase [Hyphopichia burtonii NRRL Y-1933]|uniref:Probable NADPH dehydrogenase n=1 Tax=Hyphopichia burtonii NRRL Y-1933 TaxID=984485 RepID=A0A1E4RCB4_9ASCO|nr:NADH:flavin oxidoreductase/NADH oxidase [Hyphopichia burtonii NRRL Y-1933]ODV64894.1 NADH:flavin oxidoreductase/NADH oxidase [Hyphopichia burtonii NRRL Y-1933]
MIKAVSLKDTKVFSPIKVGENEISHKIVMAPSARTRAALNEEPSDLQLKHYNDRTQFPGSLVIAEGTVLSPKTGGVWGAPGIYNHSQVQGWKKITQTIHDNNSFISLQLWACGRVTDPKFAQYHQLPVVAPSVVYTGKEHQQSFEELGIELKSLSTSEVEALIKNEYTQGAKNAMAAGFDYIEIHAAHGYLIESFLHPSTNKRTDKYGGSIENRARFLLEVVDHLVGLVGASKVAIRLSPWSSYNSMITVKEEVHPYTTFSYVVNELQRRADNGNQLAYISLVEPRVSGAENLEKRDQVGDNEFIRKIWKGTLIRAGNYTYDAPDFKQLLSDVDDDRTLVAFARFFTSNPDLPQRLYQGSELAPYDRSTFYTKSAKGYNTFPALNEKSTLNDEQADALLGKPIAQQA